MPTLEANRFGRGSGAVTTGGGAEIIKFPKGVKLTSMAVEADAASTMKVRYTFDLDAASVIWQDWDHGDADDSQVWDTVFDGGFHALEVSGDGAYSYSFD